MSARDGLFEILLESVFDVFREPVGFVIVVVKSTAVRFVFRSQGRPVEVSRNVRIEVHDQRRFVKLFVQGVRRKALVRVRNKIRLIPKVRVRIIRPFGQYW